MSVGLDTWGAKSANFTPALPANLDRNQHLEKILNKEVNPDFNPLAQVLSSQKSLVEPHGLQGHSNFFLEPSAENQMVNFGLIVLVLLFLLLILCWACWEGGTMDDDVESPAKDLEQEKQDFANLNLSDGSWAQVYREARGEQREALELLFRCNIISTDEFAFS